MSGSYGAIVSRSIALVMIVATLAASPQAVRSDDSAPVAAPGGNGPPVTINSCGPILNNNAAATPAPTIAGIAIPVSTSNGIAIEFVNESTQTAKLVNFDVNSSGTHFVIRDVGTFSPGVSIKHQYRNGTGQAFILPAFISPNVTCQVASVEFVDGSTWRRGQPGAAQPAAAASSTSPLTATPARLNVDKAADSRLFLVWSTQRVATFKEADNCGNVATIFVAATGDASSAYSVKPVAVGSCSARVTDQDGNAVTVPIVVQ
jgi:hypothetical protein